MAIPLPCTSTADESVGASDPVRSESGVGRGALSISTAAPLTGRQRDDRAAECALVAAPMGCVAVGVPITLDQPGARASSWISTSWPLANGSRPPLDSPFTGWATLCGTAICGKVPLG